MVDDPGAGPERGRNSSMTTIQRSFAALMLVAVASTAVADGGCPPFEVGADVLHQQTDEQPEKLKELVEELEEEEEEDEEPDCE